MQSSASAVATQWLRAEIFSRNNAPRLAFRFETDFCVVAVASARNQAENDARSHPAHGHSVQYAGSAAQGERRWMSEFAQGRAARGQAMSSTTTCASIKGRYRGADDVDGPAHRIGIVRTREGHQLPWHTPRHSTYLTGRRGGGGSFGSMGLKEMVPVWRPDELVGRGRGAVGGGAASLASHVVIERGVAACVRDRAPKGAAHRVAGDDLARLGRVEPMNEDRATNREAGRRWAARPRAHGRGWDGKAGRSGWFPQGL